MTSSSPLTTRLPVRLAAAAGATGVTFALGALLLGSFDRAAPARWLPASADVLEAVARCDALPARAERDRCKQAFVARMTSPDAGRVRLAADTAPAREPPPAAAAR